jgi:hypothetical protein
VRDDGCQDTGLQRQAQPGVAICRNHMIR